MVKKSSEQTATRLKTVCHTNLAIFLKINKRKKKPLIKWPKNTACSSLGIVNSCI